MVFIYSKIYKPLYQYLLWGILSGKVLIYRQSKNETIDLPRLSCKKFGDFNITKEYTRWWHHFVGAVQQDDNLACNNSQKWLTWWSLSCKLIIKKIWNQDKVQWSLHTNTVFPHACKLENNIFRQDRELSNDRVYQFLT